MSYNNSPSYLGIKFIDLSDNTEVAAAGGSNTQTLQPDAGFIYKVRHMHYDCPAIAEASGDQKLVGSYQNFDNTDYVFRINGTDSTRLLIITNSLAADSEEPSGKEEQWFLLQNKIIASNSQPFDFEYTNSSDTAQTGNRVLHILVEVYKEIL